MRNIKERLERSVITLDTLDRKRDDMRSPALGMDTEWSLIESELRELEENILQDPGPLEKYLVRIKRGE